MLYGSIFIGGFCALIGYAIGSAFRGRPHLAATVSLLVGILFDGVLAVAVLVNDQNPPVIWMVIGLLITISSAIRASSQAPRSDAACVEGLIGLLGHERVELRWDAAKRLGRLGSVAAAAVPKLKALLNDRDGLVRKTASEALALIERPTPAAPLIYEDKKVTEVGSDVTSDDTGSNKTRDTAEKQAETRISLEPDRDVCPDCGFAYLRIVSSCPKCNPRR
jgi:hypothetical protein